MNNRKYWLVVLFLLVPFLYSTPVQEKSLGEIYKSGTVRFLPELTIDETSLPEDTFFEGVVDIKCDSDGYVYVCDYKAHNIKKFNSSGKHIDTIGREGQGPGEFNTPFQIAVTDDKLIVWDMGNRRLCSLTLGGDFIKSVAFSLNDGMPQKMRGLLNGDIVIELEKIYFRELDKPQDCLIELYSPDLEKKKTVYAQQVLHNKYMRTETSLTNIPQPFSPLVYWDVSPVGRIVIGYPKKYEIEIYDSEGLKVSSFSNSYEPVKVTDKDKEKFFSGITHSVGGVRKQGAPEIIVKNTEFPKNKPAFRQIIVDFEGNILVLTYRKNREEESRFFDAFDPEGNYLGSVQIIGEVSFPLRAIIKDGSFWLQKTDEEGLIKVVKYRISD